MIILHGSWSETLPREEAWSLLNKKGTIIKQNWKGNSYQMLFGFKTSQARDAARTSLRKWGREQQREESSDFADGVDIFSGGPI